MHFYESLEHIGCIYLHWEQWFEMPCKEPCLHLSSLCTSQKDLYASSLENSSWNLLIAETQPLKPTTTLFELNELNASCLWSLVYWVKDIHTWVVTSFMPIFLTNSSGTPFPKSFSPFELSLFDEWGLFRKALHLHNVESIGNDNAWSSFLLD